MIQDENSAELDRALAEFDNWVQVHGRSDPVAFGRQQGLDQTLIEGLQRVLSLAEGVGFPRHDSDPSPSLEEPMPEFVGPYRVMRLLGSGGMGQVYLAEQTAPIRRQVAVKVIRNTCYRASFLRRFEIERHVLERLEHPNIARILDAGVGHPTYIVMEYVDGKHLTTFCDAAMLDLNSRLEVFLQLCDAVDYAHRQGIVHRDIKPSNVLVTAAWERPVVKVIDFGLAKDCLQEASPDPRYTLTGDAMAIGSLQWMSPEQARGSRAEPADTRSDIYSLGAVLYQLLSGSPPIPRNVLEASSPAEVFRMIEHEMPERPSARFANLNLATAFPLLVPSQRFAWQVALRNDLDWVVFRAMAKKRDDRYGSVAELAADLRRFMTGQPVSARRSEWSYRWSKFSRRYWRRALTAALCAACVFAAVSIVRWRSQKHIAEAHHRAQKEMVSRTQLQSLYQASLDTIGPYKSGKGYDSERAKHQLKQQLQELDSQQFDNPVDEACLRYLIAIELQEVGCIPECLQTLRRVVTLHDETDNAQAELSVEHRVGLIFVLQNLGQLEEARAEIDAARKIAERHLAEDSAAWIHLQTAELKYLLQLQQYDRVIRSGRALVKRIRRMGLGPGSPIRIAYTEAEFFLAQALMARQDLKATLAAMDRCLEVAETLSSDEHKAILEYKLLRYRVAARLNLPGSVNEAMAICREFERRFGKLDKVTLCNKSAVLVIMLETYQTEAAATLAEELLRDCRKAFGEEHLYSLMALRNIAGVHVIRGDHTKAIQVYEECRDILIQRRPDLIDERIAVLYLLGKEMHAAGRFQECLSLVEEVLADPELARPQNEFWRALPLLRGLALTQLDRPREAIELLRKYRADVSSTKINSPQVIKVHAHLGDAYLGCGRFQDAERSYAITAEWYQTNTSGTEAFAGLAPRNSLVAVQLLLGDYAAAEVNAERILADAQLADTSIKDLFAIQVVRASLARAEALIGLRQPEEAERQLKSIDSSMTDIPTDLRVQRAMVIALIHELRGEFLLARKYFLESVRLIKDSEVGPSTRWVFQRALRASSRFFETHGDPQEASQARHRQKSYERKHVAPFTDANSCGMRKSADYKHMPTRTAPSEASQLV